MAISNSLKGELVVTLAARLPAVRDAIDVGILFEGAILEQVSVPA